MHLDFMAQEAVPARRGRREVTVAPRGHAKTTFKALIKVIHAIVYGYEPFIVIVGHSEVEAINKLKDIRDELEFNQRLIDVYGLLKPVTGQSMGSKVWRTREFITTNNVKVIAKSRGSQFRGLKHGQHRPSLIILDDIESPEGVLTEEQRFKTRDWFSKDILKMGDTHRSTNIFVIGTRLHQESLLSELLETPGWQAQKYQAVLSFATNHELWAQWTGILCDLSLPNAEADADAFYNTHQAAMLEGTQVLWPEGEPYDALMKIRVTEGQASFQSEKQNDPYDPDRQIFAMHQVRRFKVNWEQGRISGLEWLDESEKNIPSYRIDKVVAFHDPAVASTTTSDYAAIVVVAKDHDGYFYTLDAVVERMSIDRQIKTAFKLHKKWGFSRLYLETNNFQVALKHNYQDIFDTLPDQPFRLSGVTQHQNKEKRISSLEPLVTNGQLLFADDLNQRFWSQMELYPTTHDDGPDALHGAVSQLRLRGGTITVAQEGCFIH